MFVKSWNINLLWAGVGGQLSRTIAMKMQAHKRTTPPQKKNTKPQTSLNKYKYRNGKRHTHTHKDTKTLTCKKKHTNTNTRKHAQKNWCKRCVVQKLFGVNGVWCKKGLMQKVCVVKVVWCKCCLVQKVSGVESVWGVLVGEVDCRK